MSLTTDRNDPDLGRGIDTTPVEQNRAYLISESKGPFVRPVRQTYIHLTCRASTTMALPLAQTYARDPKFYGATYCVRCKMHRPVEEFTWEDGKVVGS